MSLDVAVRCAELVTQSREGASLNWTSDAERIVFFAAASLVTEDWVLFEKNEGVLVAVLPFANSVA